VSAQHRDYDAPPMEPADVDRDPIAQFRRWFEDARAAGIEEPEAMTVSTTAPAARIVLLRGVDERGFSFFTNYDSGKARDLTVNARAAMAFGWHALQLDHVLGPRVHLAQRLQAHQAGRQHHRDDRQKCDQQLGVDR